MWVASIKMSLLSWDLQKVTYVEAPLKKVTRLITIHIRIPNLRMPGILRVPEGRRRTRRAPPRTPLPQTHQPFSLPVPSLPSVLLHLVIPHPSPFTPPTLPFSPQRHAFPLFSTFSPFFIFIFFALFIFIPHFSPLYYTYISLFPQMSRLSSSHPFNINHLFFLHILHLTATLSVSNVPLSHLQLPTLYFSSFFFFRSTLHRFFFIIFFPLFSMSCVDF